jgi:hypothetical protein
MALEVGLLFLKKLSCDWEPTVWEAREEVVIIQEVVEEGMCRVVEEIIRVVEEEVATQIR